MKLLLCLLFITSAAFAGVRLAPDLTDNDLHDVVELLKFIRTAKPELFDEFATKFEYVGASCDAGEADEKDVREFARVIDSIERELPDDNKSLLSKIKLALFFGGKKMYRPNFTQEHMVRENITKFMQTVHDAFADGDFELCSNLIARASESRRSGQALAATRLPNSFGIFNH